MSNSQRSSVQRVSHKRARSTQRSVDRKIGLPDALGAIAADHSVWALMLEVRGTGQPPRRAPGVESLRIALHRIRPPPTGVCVLTVHPGPGARRQALRGACDELNDVRMRVCVVVAFALVITAFAPAAATAKSCPAGAECR